MSPNTIAAPALEWALLHFATDGDTDFLPRPIELDALRVSATQVIKEASSIDVSSHVWRGLRTLLIPKDEHSFRPISQLDPLDALLFAAIIRDVGDLVERRRIPFSEDTVFSYRFDPTPTGHFYGDKGHWEDFWATSERQAIASGFVVITDITDFYNQVSHHVVENELIAAGVLAHIRTALLNLLKHSTQGVSRGLPVGPHPAHLLAELSLVGVDEVLRLKGYRFCRYVDDIHIFCATKEDAQVALFELADILDKTQKLSLNRKKTELVPSAAFVSRARTMLAETPINDEERAILHVIRARSRNPYSRISLSQLQDTELAAFSQDRIERILNAYLSASEPNFIRIRWFLRRLAQLGVPGAVELVVRHIKLLLPAIGDAAGYLATARDSYTGRWADIGEQLLSALALPLVRKSEYLQVILLSLFSRITGLDHLDRLVRTFDTHGPAAKREIILAAAEGGLASWLRGFKTSYTTFDPWSRRAVLYSAKTFPQDERRYWLNLVKKDASPLERILIDWIR